MYKFQKVTLEPLYETWLKFKKNLTSVPNNRIMRRNFLKIFNRALNVNTKIVDNTIIGGAFVSLHKD